ncbi:MAG: hypothetical protein JW990_02370 [Thermoleophilia bacterium]|nr:hypothetical protein [Thermoleophilia bacterium]
MGTALRYPKYDLDNSIEVARRITERGAGATVSAHELAALLGYTSINNGAYLTRVASSRLFGLIEGSSKSISATERADAIIHADYPDTERRARLEAFKSVPLFAAFLEAYQGRELPDDQGMANTLTSRFHIPVGDARLALSRMLSSAEQAGLFDVGGPTRMIEPTLTGSAVREAPPSENGPTPPPPAVASPPMPLRRGLSPLIEATLELMPSGPPWEQEEYEQWLDFFDQACRVYYRIPRARRMKEV